MKRLLATVVFTGLFGYYSPALAGTPRGARCHDEACFEKERMSWRVAESKADGHLAARVDKMLAKWTQLGFPDNGFIDKTYAKIHAEYVAELRKAGLVWFYETQGYDKPTTFTIVDNLAVTSEEEIVHGMVTAWLYKADL